MEKIGLVLEGGGLRGAYTAGALAWLNDHDITFDYGVGISSGAVYLACYEMKNKQAAHDMAVVYACEPENVGMKALIKEGHYVAYNRIFEVDLKQKSQFSIRQILDEKPNMEVGVYVLEHGGTEFYGPEDMDEDCILLLGACALPIASDIIHWKNYHVLDGGITKMIPIERAQEVGCTKFLVITTKPKDYVRKPANGFMKSAMKTVYRQYPQIGKYYAIRHLNYYKQIEIVRGLVEDGNAVHIMPTQSIKVSRFKGDPKNCQALYDLGYSDMEERKEEIYALMACREGQ